MLYWFITKPVGMSIPVSTPSGQGRTSDTRGARGYGVYTRALNGSNTRITIHRVGTVCVGHDLRALAFYSCNTPKLLFCNVLGNSVTFLQPCYFSRSGDTVTALPCSPSARSAGLGRGAGWD